MIRPIRFIAGALAALLVLSCGSCGSGSGSSTNTVLVYMIGSDLESQSGAATKNIQQMLAVSNTTGLNVVLQTGGASSSSGPLGIDWTHVQRYLVHNGQLQLLQDLGPDASVDMGSAATLADFLAWGASSYPAGRQMLVLWDHGGGPNGGFGLDEITGSQLSLVNLAASLQTAGVSFDVIGFDACLMGSAEVASALRPYASYLVASQDLEPGQGWDYTPWLSYLQAHPQTSSELVGQSIVDAYVGQGLASPITLSVVDLAAMPAVVSAMNSFALAAQPYAARSVLSWQVLADARLRTLDFHSPAFLLGGASGAADLVDVLQLAGNVENGIVKTFGSDTALSSAVSALVNAVNAAVVYRGATLGDSSATGLSVYFPGLLSSYPGQNYAAHLTIGGQNAFASSYVDALLPAYYDYYAANLSSLVAGVTTQPVAAGAFDATVVNGFDFVMVGAGRTACTVYVAGVAQQQLCIEAMQQATEYTHEIGATSWQFSFTLSGTWPTLQGQAVALLPDASVTQGISSPGYLIPAHYKDASSGSYLAGYLRVAMGDSGGVTTYTVIGFQLSGKVPGKTYELQAGDIVALDDFTQDAQAGWSFQRSNREITLASASPTVDAGSYALSPGSPLIYAVSDLTGTPSVGAVQSY